jgi:hypothetical protein
VPDAMPLVRLQAVRPTVLGKTSAALCRLAEMLDAGPLAFRQLLTRNLQHFRSPVQQHNAAWKASLVQVNLGTTGIPDCLPSDYLT